MPTRLRKIRKQRGSRYHGWGQVGQHRRSGTRGGRGKAGLHKHKWTWTVKYAPDYFGPDGFIPPTQIVVKKWINVSQLDDLAKDIVESNDKKVTVNLTQMGYDKLLGQGKISRAYQIVVSKCSESAKRKIEETGGSIVAG